MQFGLSDEQQMIVDKYFETATYHWRIPRLTDFEKLAQTQKPDIVIEQWVERALPKAQKLKEYHTLALHSCFDSEEKHQQWASALLL